MGIHGPVAGIMTGQTVHRFAVARVEGLVPDGVGKLFMFLVATRTDFLWLSPQHGRPVSAVFLVTLAADMFSGMLMDGLLPPFEFDRVALPTGFTRVADQQVIMIGGMGIVAVETQVAGAVSPQVGMGVQKGCQNFLVAG